MKYLALVLMMLTGCATVGTEGDRNAFVNAANSWRGGNIKDMIQVWGNPNRGFKEPNDTYGLSGQAAWLDAEEVPEPRYVRESKTQTRYNCSGQVYGNYLSADCKERRTDGFSRGYNRGLEQRYARRKQRAHRCEVYAEFDADGTITKVQASSKNCDTRYRGRLSALTR
jgi:hypothetical protein